MPSILTWNIYHGTINNITPMNRLTQIATLCQNYNVDIICLQEVPQNTLDNQLANGFGIPNIGTQVMITLNNVNNFLGNYTVLQGYAENNPNNPKATNTTDGYLIVFRNATFPNGWNNLGYYQPQNFRNQYGTYLRPPIQVNLVDNNHNTTFLMNWHAEANAPAAGWSLEILDVMLPSANQIPNNTVYVIAGDFNVRGSFSGVFGNQQNFIGWDNIVATYPGASNLTIQGLDHILTSVNSNPILGNQLNFTSDAYHYPIAAQF